MYAHLGDMNTLEGIKLEPSALAGIIGPIKVSENNEYKKRMGFSDQIMKNATHLVWATGGGMVPEEEMRSYIGKNTIIKT